MLVGARCGCGDCGSVHPFVGVLLPLIAKWNHKPPSADDDDDANNVRRFSYRTFKPVD